MEISPGKRVGLALGGGVARGLAHIGVLSVLGAAGIPIDLVAGSSAGSVVGAVYCASSRIEDLKSFARNLRWWRILRPVWPVRGLFDFDPLARWIVHELGDLQFSDLEITFAAIATDLETGSPIRIQEGRLAPAVQASCSVPGIVAPVRWNGRWLGDGSLTNTIPVSALREMGADYVIGVDIFSPSVRRRWGPVGWGLGALEILVGRAGGGFDEADCLITPDLSGASYLRFAQRERFYRAGEEAARVKLGQICHDLGLSQNSSTGKPALQHN